MKNIRLIATDLDGTFFTDNKDISVKNMKAASDAFERGILIVPATGRSLYTIPKKVLELNCIRYVITSNGAGITDLKNGKSIYKNQLDSQTAFKVIDIALSVDIMVEIFTEGRAYILKKFADNLINYGVNPKFKDWILDTRNTVNNFSEILSETSTVENINLIFTDLNKREKIYKYIINNLNVEVTNSLGNNLEIGRKGCSKGTALENLTALLNMDMENTMCFGDNENDRDMIIKAGIGVAMANGEESVKSVADYITKSNNDDGFAEAVYKFAVKR